MHCQCFKIKMQTFIKVNKIIPCKTFLNSIKNPIRDEEKTFPYLPVMKRKK